MNETADTANLNLLRARTLVDELTRGGVAHVCLSPGARSAPLALAATESQAVTTSVHLDERSAAFFALGRALATGVPSVLVCTSGTAAANYLPAVIESYQARVPMVVLTADRPAELRDTGARQTIDQSWLYGRHCRWFADVAAPSGHTETDPYIRNLVARAVAVALGPPAGPVHLNLQFREPLVPASVPAATSVGGRPEGAEWLERLTPDLLPSPELTGKLAALLESAERGLLVAGPIRAADDYAANDYAASVTALASAAGYPILADPEGGLRFGRHDRSNIVDGYDSILRSKAWREGHVPDVVVRLGASVTSKSLNTFLADHHNITQVVIDPDGRWDDPSRSARYFVGADPTAMCSALAEVLSANVRGRSGGDEERGWRCDWLAASETIREVVDSAGAAAEIGAVAWVYPILQAALPEGALLYGANSMAVRDIDTFCAGSETSIRCLSNRGAAGIDGTISSALGAAHGSGAPTLLVTGDLAFVHDMNGLLAAQVPGANVVILVLNDGGGGIFRHLPVADYPAEIFERCFATPTRVDIASACAAYGVDYARAVDGDRLADCLKAALSDPGVTVLEVVLDPNVNTRVHREIWRAAVRELA